MKEVKSRNTVLIIDDDELFCDAVKEHLETQKIEVLTANTGSDGMKLLKRRRVGVVLLDQRLTDVEGHTLCPQILRYNDQTQIIFITAHPSFEGAIHAIRSGAHDYLSKPFEMEELVLATQRAFKMLDYEKLTHFDEYRRSKDTKQTVLIGEKGLAEVRRLVDLASIEEASVLITGETGTGKNVAAKAIHYKSPNSKKPFVSINCAALPDNLIEAELFGHSKGAFTGATSAKRGIFEMAEGGTLFLDEIGEMPISLQTKLLSVLEDKKVRRVGGESFIPVDVRVIAATSKNLEESLGHTFRTDLYYRLSVIHIHLPPLRERRQDIPEICDYLLNNVLCRKNQVEINSQEIKSLMEYDWPGNVRELKNILERASILGQGGQISPSTLLRRMPGNFAYSSLNGHGCDMSIQLSGNGVLPLGKMEKQHILYALQHYENNYTHTAKALGIALSTLKRKLKEYRMR
jgi:DNA-binding NtrC family response regulator